MHFLKIIFLLYILLPSISYANQYSLANFGLDTKISPPLFPTTSEDCRQYSDILFERERAIFDAYYSCVKNTSGNSTNSHPQCRELFKAALESTTDASSCYSTVNAFKALKNKIRNEFVYGSSSLKDMMTMGLLSGSLENIGNRCRNTSNSSILAKECHSSVVNVANKIREVSVKNPSIGLLQSVFSNAVESNHNKILRDLGEFTNKLSSFNAGTSVQNRPKNNRRSNVLINSNTNPTSRGYKAPTPRYKAPTPRYKAPTPRYKVPVRRYGNKQK